MTTHEPFDSFKQPAPGRFLFVQHFTVRPLEPETSPPDLYYDDERSLNVDMAGHAVVDSRGFGETMTSTKVASEPPDRDVDYQDTLCTQTFTEVRAERPDDDRDYLGLGTETRVADEREDVSSQENALSTL